MTTQDGRAVWSELTGHIVLHSKDIIGTGGDELISEVVGIEKAQVRGRAYPSR